ncbi:(Lyso)-N-acylphosphatidylethanolamine lipase [Coregonus clupeaformis]|uniref:(Lyso)-N-acylphosphatidylethanolamine lipase n=1 Tax=Coregonus clupeaformis TaxID=59861 RepID=UPI001BDFEA7D|nr:(Lyso)-N-acylphosphatidylethanolamine lipase [Coregonus clupeaformis]
MSESLGWAKCPILDRVDLLPPSLPVTLVCGGGSWMDRATEARVAELRPNSYTCTVVVEGAAHDVYADQPEGFNILVQSNCDIVDQESLCV